MSRAGLRRAGTALAIVLALTACSGGGSSSKSSSSTKSSSSKSSKSSSSPKKAKSDASSLSDVSDFADNTPVLGKTKYNGDDDDKIIKASVKDIETFWSEEFPQLYGKPYDKISNGLHPYSESKPPPTCPLTNQPGSYADNPQNAFYCIRGDYMAWDTEHLTNDLLDQFGPFTLAIVAAHELGHGISARAGVYDSNPPTFLTEQQADCFAGAYTRWVAEGNSGLFDLQLSDLDSALGGFLQIRDPVGFDSVNDPGGHGSAFQRINAFEDGLGGGATTCKDYANGSFTVVPDTFTDETDYTNQGNLPPDQVEPLAIQNLETFWSKVATDLGETWTALKTQPFDPDSDTVSCGNDSVKGQDAIGVSYYCDQSDTAFWDEKYLMPAANQIGDLAQAMIIGDLYSERAQYLSDFDRNSLVGHLQASCFTGVWVGTLVEGQITKDLTLSPGDLDEAVASFLKFSDSSGQSDYGSAFQRLDAFRLGFLDSYNKGYNEGLKSCVASAQSAASSDSAASDAFSS